MSLQNFNQIFVNESLINKHLFRTCNKSISCYYRIYDRMLFFMYNIKVEYQFLKTTSQQINSYHIVDKQDKQNCNFTLQQSNQMTQYESLYSLAKILTGRTITSLSEIGQLMFLKQLLKAIDDKDFQCVKKRSKKHISNTVQPEICNWNQASSLAEILEFIFEYYSNKMETNISSWIDKINVYRDPIQLWKIVLGIGIRGPNNSKFINIVLEMNPDRNLQELTNQVIQKLQNYKQSKTFSQQVTQSDYNNKRGRRQSSDFKEIAQLGQEIEYLRGKYTILKKQYQTYKKQTTSYRVQIQNQLKIYRKQKANFENVLAQTGFYRGGVNATPGQVVGDLCEQIQRLSRQIQKQKEKVKIIRQDNQELMNTLQDFQKVNNEYQITKKSQIQLQNVVQQMAKQLEDYRNREKEYYMRLQQLETENIKLSKNLKSQFQQRKNVNLNHIDDSINVETNVTKKKLGAMGKQKSTTVLKYDYKDQSKKSKIHIPYYQQSPEKSAIFQPQTMRNLLNQMKSPQINSQLEKLKQQNLIIRNENRMLRAENEHLTQVNMKYQNIIKSYKQQNNQVIQKYETLYDQLFEKCIGQASSFKQQFIRNKENKIIQQIYDSFHQKQAQYESRLNQIQIKLQKAKNKYRQSKIRNKNRKKQKKTEKQNLQNFRRSFMRFDRSSYNPNQEAQIQNDNFEHMGIQENDPQLALNFNFKKGHSQLQVVPEQMTQRTNVQNIESIAQNNFDDNFQPSYKQSIDSESGPAYQRNNFDNSDDYRMFNYDGSFQTNNNVGILATENLLKREIEYQDVNIQEFDPIDQADIQRDSVTSQNQQANVSQQNSAVFHYNQGKQKEESQQPYCSIIITPPTSSILNQRSVSTIFEDQTNLIPHKQRQILNQGGILQQEAYENETPDNLYGKEGVSFNFQKRNSLEQYPLNSNILLPFPSALKKHISHGKKGQIQQVLVDDWDIRSRSRSINSRIYQFTSQVQDYQQEQQNNWVQEQSLESQDYENLRQKIVKKLDFECNIFSKEVLRNSSQFEQKLREYMILIKETSKDRLIELEKQLQSVTKNHMTINQMMNGLFLKYIENQTKQNEEKRRIERQKQQQIERAQNAAKSTQQIQQNRVSKLRGDSSEVMELLRGITKQKQEMLSQLQNLRRVKEDRDIQSGKVKQLLEVIEKLRNQFQQFRKQQEIIKMKLRSALNTNVSNAEQQVPKSQQQPFKDRKKMMELSHRIINQKIENYLSISHKNQLKREIQDLAIQTQFFGQQISKEDENKKEQVIHKQKRKQIFFMNSNQISVKTSPAKIRKYEFNSIQSIAINQPQKNYLPVEAQKHDCQACNMHQQLSLLAKLQNQVLSKSFEQLEKKNEVLTIQIQVMTGAIAELRQMAKCRSFFK